MIYTFITQILIWAIQPIRVNKGKRRTRKAELMAVRG